MLMFKGTEHKAESSVLIVQTIFAQWPLSPAVGPTKSGHRTIYIKVCVRRTGHISTVTLMLLDTLIEIFDGIVQGAGREEAVGADRQSMAHDIGLMPPA